MTSISRRFAMVLVNFFILVADSVIYIVLKSLDFRLNIHVDV